MDNAEFWSSFGFWTLVVGLVGDVAVLTIPKHRDRLEKILSALFTIAIAARAIIRNSAKNCPPSAEKKVRKIGAAPWLFGASSLESAWNKRLQEFTGATDLLQ
jgi:hypothetical protein